MKKLLFFLSIVLLSSCSANNTIEDLETVATENYPVRFSVSNFKTDIQDLRTTAYLDSTGLKAFYLLITNADGVYVEAIEKTNLSDLSSLQNIEVQLPKGNYTAYSILLDNWDPKGEPNLPMTGENGYLGKKMIMENNYSYQYFYGLSEVITSYSYLLDGKTYAVDGVFNFNTQLYDYFYKATNFTVTADGAAVKQVLPRITGKVEFHFTDIKPLDNSVYPEDMYYAYVHLDAMSGVDLNDEYYAGVGSPGFYLTRKQWSELATKPLFFYTRGSEGKRLLIKIIDPTKPFVAMSPNENVDDSNQKDKYIISNVAIYENKKTIMTGALDKSSGFDYSIDDAWDESINVQM